MIDLNQYERFVVTRRRSMTATPSVSRVDIYEFALADAGGGTPPVCRLRQRVARFSDLRWRGADGRDDAPQPAAGFDTWARYELTDTGLDTIGEIQKVFVP